MEIYNTEDNKTISYNQEVQPYHHIISELVCKYLSSNEATIIELGCGPGNILKILQDMNISNDISVADVDERCINICQERYQIFETFYIDTDKALTENLNYKQYDIVIFSHVLHYADSPKDILLEIIKVIKDHGIIILAVPNSINFLTIYKNIIRKNYSSGIFSWDKNVIDKFLSDFSNLKIIEYCADYVPLPLLHKYRSFDLILKFLLNVFPLFSFSNIYVLQKTK